jgi:transcriptional regulator with PAS, ATPase and Fis domain
MNLKSLLPQAPKPGASEKEQLEFAEKMKTHMLSSNALYSPLVRESWIKVAVARFITSNEQMLETLRTASMLCKLSAPVLITGPSGTGKELIAQLLHTGRTRASGEPEPFQAINAAGIPDQLLESLLFGYKQGAFSGAVRDSTGLIESAGDGTMFLDEIGELSHSHQAKLLRVIQERKVRPIGALYEVDIKCRFVFATRRNLFKMVQDGEFRDDLFFRIAAATLRTTALKDRPEDVQPIAQAICKARNWGTPSNIPDVVIQSNGNVRALEAYLFRTEVLSLPEEEAVRDL